MPGLYGSPGSVFRGRAGGGVGRPDQAGMPVYSQRNMAPPMGGGMNPAAYDRYRALTQRRATPSTYQPGMGGVLGDQTGNPVNSGGLFGNGGSMNIGNSGITAGIGQGTVNNARAFLGSVPFGMNPDAVGQMTQQATDAQNAQRQIEDTDIQRRGAFEQARMDLARQIGQGENTVGFGNLLARLREGDQDLQFANQGFLLDMLGGL